MIEQHKQTGADLTIAAKIVPIEEASRFGVLETDQNLRIKNFVENQKSQNQIRRQWEFMSSQLKH